MNKRIKFEHCKSDHFHSERESIVVDYAYDFEDFLKEKLKVKFQEDEEGSKWYWILDEDGERTGESFWVAAEEETNEELRDNLNRKIVYSYLPYWERGMPWEWYGEQKDYIITDGVYNFEDYLMDNEVKFQVDEKYSERYWVLDEVGKRTGAVYWIVEEEDIYEDLYW